MKALKLPNINAVTKSRFIVKESYSLSLAEHRLILSCISKLDRNEKVPDSIMLTASEYENDWPEVNRNVYRDLSTAVNSLYERDIKLSEPMKMRMRLRWVQSVKFMDGDGYVELRFSDELKPMLGELKKNFVQFRMNEIRSFKSAHSIRLFELLMQFKSTGWYEISPDELRKAFNLEDTKSYQLYSQLKRRVIDPAVKEITAKSIWLIDYEEIKKGRKITKLRFHFVKL